MFVGYVLFVNGFDGTCVRLCVCVCLWLRFGDCVFRRCFLLLRSSSSRQGVVRVSSWHPRLLPCRQGLKLASTLQLVACLCVCVCS